MPLPLIPGVPDFYSLGNQLGWTLPPNLFIGNYYLANFTNVDGGYAHNQGTGQDYCFSPWPEEILGIGADYTDGYNPTGHPVQALYIEGQSCTNQPGSPVIAPPTPILPPPPPPGPIIDPTASSPGWCVYCDASGLAQYAPADNTYGIDSSWQLIGCYASLQEAQTAASSYGCSATSPLSPVQPATPPPPQTGCPAVCQTPLQVIVHVPGYGQSGPSGPTADPSNAVGIDQPAAFRFEQRTKPWFRDAVAWMMPPYAALVNSTSEFDHISAINNQLDTDIGFYEELSS